MANLIGNPNASVVTTMDDINLDGSTPASPETFNSRYKILLDNDAALKKGVEAANQSSTADQVLAKLKGVDGAGTGLDADLLDGKHAAEFFDTSKRFQVSSALVDGTIASNQNKLIYRLLLSLTPRNRVILRRVRSSFGSVRTGLRVNIDSPTPYVITSNTLETTPNTVLFDGNGSNTILEVYAFNSTNVSETLTSPLCFWLDLEVLTV